jgi:hypothetical protein
MARSNARRSTVKPLVPSAVDGVAILQALLRVFQLDISRPEYLGPFLNVVRDEFP